MTIGCAANANILCIEYEFCCKPGGSCLVPCGCMGCRCTSPSTCIKLQQQTCCCASAIAFPCDDEVPCTVAMCFLLCYPKVGCLVKVADVKGEKSGGDDGGAAEDAGES